MSDYFIVAYYYGGYARSIHQIDVGSDTDTRGLLELNLREGTKSIPVFWEGDGRQTIGAEEEMNYAEEAHRRMREAQSRGNDA